MEFITVMVIMSIILGVPGIIYLYDPKGWNATGRRLSNIVRASVESGKAVRALESRTRDHQKALEADWDAQYEGKELESGKPKPAHEIVKTRTRPSSLGPGNWDTVYIWECRCGVKGTSVEKQHVFNYQWPRHLEQVKRKQEEERIKEEFRKKGLDREW